MLTIDIERNEATTARIEHVVFVKDASHVETKGSSVHFEPKLPDWFEKGLDDCRQGRVIDMDIALREPPPGE